MKVKVKTLDQKQFSLEIDESDSIEVIKTKIQAERDNDPALDPAISKLIWKGKILTNTQTVKDAGVSEKGFFVIMPGKVTSTSKKPENTSSSSKPVEPKKNATESKPATSTATSGPTTACYKQKM